MEFLRTANIKLYPNRKQKAALLNTEGAVRFVYNWAIATNKKAYLEYKAGLRQYPMSLEELSKAFTVYRNSEESPWLKETNCASQQRSITYAWDALKALWAGNAGYPRFHKKGYRGSFYVHNNSMHINGNRVFISKVGNVKLSELPRYTGKVMSSTVVREGNEWRICITYKLDYDPRPVCRNPERKIGIDLGIKHLATLSDGSVIDKPEELKKLRARIDKLRKALFRAKKSSKRREKLIRKYQKANKNYNRYINDFLQKQSTILTKSHGIIVAETLGVDYMLRTAGNKRFRDMIARSYMQPFAKMLAYKAQDFRQVPRYYKSTRTCSRCGHINEKLRVETRMFACEACGHHIDRDINAAVNLYNYSGQVMSSKARGQQVTTRWTRNSVSSGGNY